MLVKGATGRTRNIYILMDWNGPGQVWSIHCDSRLRYVRWLTRVLLYRTSITGEETKWCTLLYMVAVWYDLNFSISLLLLRLTWGVYRGLSVVQNWPTRIITGYGSHGKYALQWRHNVRDCVLNHLPRDYLLNHLIRQIKESMKAPRHRRMCGEFTDDRWIISRTNAN